MKAIIIMGSTYDEPHAKKITDVLDKHKIQWEQHAASAHKQPLKVLEIINENKNEDKIVYITIAAKLNTATAMPYARRTLGKCHTKRKDK